MDLWTVGAEPFQFARFVPQNSVGAFVWNTVDSDLLGSDVSSNLKSDDCEVERHSSKYPFRKRAEKFICRYPPLVYAAHGTKRVSTDREDFRQGAEREVKSDPVSRRRTIFSGIVHRVRTTGDVTFSRKFSYP